MDKIKTKEFFRTLYHRKWVRTLTAPFLWTAFPVVGFYMYFIEPKLVKVSNIKIPVKKLPEAFENFKIVQISDLHYGPTNQSTKFFKKCIRTINELKPNLVALTGDYLQWDKKYLKSLANLLGGLKSEHGVMAVLGNHDYGVSHKGHPPTDDIDYEEVIFEFEKQGIKVLHNEATLIKKESSELTIAGVGDFWTEHFLPHKTLKQKNQNNNQPTILLCHNPDSIDFLDNFHFDLMLAGHVHGGQVSFPLIGPLAVPVKNRHLRRGLHKLGDRWLYTNRGLGHIFRARLLSRPDITCLELVSSVVE